MDDLTITQLPESLWIVSWQVIYNFSLITNSFNSFKIILSLKQNLDLVSNGSFYCFVLYNFN